MHDTAKFNFDRHLGFIGILLLLLASAVVASLSKDTLRYLDEVEYDQLGHALVQQHEFSYHGGDVTLYRPPGYAFVLAAVYQFGGSPYAAKLLNCLALAATAFLLMRLSNRIFPAYSSFVPYVMLCYPVFAYAAGTLYPQTIGGLLLIASIRLVARPQPTSGQVVGAGILYGFLCLAIPSFLYITPFFLGYIILSRRKLAKPPLISAGVFLVAMLVTIAPWTIRNGIVFHAFVPISANGGTNLVLGNSPATRGNHKPTLKEACGQVPYIPDEVEFDRANEQCAIDWITANPGAATTLYFAKLVNYFNFRNELTTATQRESWQDWSIFATYYPLLLVALVRLALFRRYPISGLEWFLYAIYLGNGVLSAVFFTRVRFRIPFDLILVAIDVAFLARVVTARKTRAAPVLASNS